MTTRRAVLFNVGLIGLFGLAGCTDSGPNPLGDANEDDMDERREILDWYDNALADWNTATEARNRGIEHFNAENYADAIESYETAVEGYTEAETGFVEARSRTYETGRDEAIAICEAAVENTRLHLEATEAALDGAIAARDNAPPVEINDYILAFQELTEEAENIDLRNTDDLVAALDLDG